MLRIDYLLEQEFIFSLERMSEIVRAAGLLIFRRATEIEFLLLKERI